MVIQIITKDNKVVCKTTVPYPPQTIRELKKAGYKVRELIKPPDDSNDHKEGETYETSKN